MTDTENHRSAPVPVGDVVPGDLPVPITVWPVPLPRAGETMSSRLGYRLVQNLTYPGDLVVDLTIGVQLARAVIASRRRSQLPRGQLSGSEPAALIVAGWPSMRLHLAELAERSFHRLRPGGCLAVVHRHGDPTIQPQIIAAGRAARLSYLQHIVASTEPVGAAEPLPIHSDVILLTRSRRAGAEPIDTEDTFDTEDHDA
jgi:hypothetical protein